MKQVLLIDDDDQIRELLRLTLERFGMSVLEAGNGKDGIKLFRQQPVDIIITDIFMPEKEGIETIAEIRKISPWTKIIAMSGGSVMLEAEQVLKIARLIGADKILEKPFPPEKLLRTVNELLS